MNSSPPMSQLPKGISSTGDTITPTPFSMPRATTPLSMDKIASNPPTSTRHTTTPLGLTAGYKAGETATAKTIGSPSHASPRKENPPLP